jgi:hypothetical protein
MDHRQSMQRAGHERPCMPVRGSSVSVDVGLAFCHAAMRVTIDNVLAIPQGVSEETVGRRHPAVLFPARVYFCQQDATTTVSHIQGYLLYFDAHLEPTSYVGTPNCDIPTRDIASIERFQGSYGGDSNAYTQTIAGHGPRTTGQGWCVVDSSLEMLFGCNDAATYAIALPASPRAMPVAHLSELRILNAEQAALLRDVTTECKSLSRIKRSRR